MFVCWSDRVFLQILHTSSDVRMVGTGETKQNGQRKLMSLLMVDSSRPFRVRQSTCQYWPHFEQSIFQDLLSEDLPQGHSLRERWLTERDGGCEEEAAWSGLVFCDGVAEALEVKSDLVAGLGLFLLVLTDLTEGDWDDDREFIGFLSLTISAGKKDTAIKQRKLTTPLGGHYCILS